MDFELLSPAKDLTHGIAAINHGADAVYIGAPRFGARAAVGNSIQVIEKLCSYAHLFNCKVYIALNTLLTDSEIDDAASIISQVYNCGADAIIIQDMGLLEMDLPPIPLFASTQTHNATYEKVLFLQKVGFQRVILARELGIGQISEIRQHTTVELETFVHGAICVSYSGQCYMSEATTGRSGNRGECAQSCRQLYSLVDANGTPIVKDKHLLSVKDLNLSRYLRLLMAAGVSSFKIEGRLKDINYVKNITSLYRKELDAILDGKENKKSSSGQCLFNFEPDASKTFSRGFTDYFVNERQQSIGNFDTPKAIGTEVGNVVQVSSTSFSIQHPGIVHNNDGLCFIDQKGTLQGIKVNRVEGCSIFPFRMPNIVPGTLLYRNQDVLFEKELSLSENIRYIEVKMRLEESPNGVIITARDEDQNTVSYSLECEKHIARDTEKAKALVDSQLKKSGGSVFVVSEVVNSLSQQLFFPLSTLNELRRKVLDLLEGTRRERYSRPVSLILKNDYPYPCPNVDYRANILNQKAKTFYHRHLSQADNEPGKINDFKGKIVMTTKFCLRFELGYCLLSKNNQHPGRFEQPIFIVDKHNKYRLDFDCKTCNMNIVLV